MDGDLERAQADYELVLAVDPDNSTAENNLGFLLAQKGRYAEAIAHYEAAARLNPKRAETFNGLGVCRGMAGQFPELREILELAPGMSREALVGGTSAEWTCELPDVGRVRCLSFRDQRGPGAVTAVGDSGTILSTTDGGVTWAGRSGPTDGLASAP